MGGRGAYSSSGLGIDKALNSIRNAKKENLLVFDSSGNVIATEKGNAYHTGYADIDYRNKIVAHNHPEKVYPYPSEKDFKTAEKSGMKEMIVVSSSYDIKYSIDESYKGYGREGLAYRIEQNKSRINKMKLDINKATLKRYKAGGYKNAQEYRKDTIIKQTDAVLKEYKKLAKNSGYKFSYKKVKK